MVTPQSPDFRPPLHGIRVVITRAREEAAALRSELERYGAEVIELPAIGFATPLYLRPLDAALQNLAAYQWVTFTSRHAVEAVFERLRVLGIEALPPGLRVAALGDTTAELLCRRGVEDLLLPGVSTARGLADALIAEGIRGVRVLVPASDLARPELRERLEKSGASVEQIIAYRTVLPHSSDGAGLEMVRAGGAQVIAFTSPSALHNVLTMLGEDRECLRSMWIACIGPTTARALREEGFEPAAVALAPSNQGLRMAIYELLTKGRT